MAFQQPPVTTNNLSIVIPGIGSGFVDQIILIDGSGCDVAFPNSFSIHLILMALQ
ncbi:MAG: hypothetical protein IPG39_03000 [Bacteroidetes bacterium]|nr:hypothetical protein [Bacteroidota bacterium]